MLKEIDEQPIVMRRLVEKYTDNQQHVVIPENLMKALQNADRLYIVAAGTSYHAGLVGAPLFEQLAGIPTEVHVASEFAFQQPLLSKHPLFIFLTQSGETADIRQVLVEVKAQGYQTLTITNVGSSTLAREATFTLLLHGGPEIAVASTKAYTAQIAVEALVAKAVGEAKGLQNAKDFDVIHQLGLAATGQQALIDQKDRIHELATDMFKTTRNAFYIGRGGDYYASLEAARYYTLPWRAKPKKVTRLSSTKLIRFWRHWLRSSQHNCWLTSRVPIVGMTLTVPATWLSRLLLNRSKLIMA